MPPSWTHGGRLSAHQFAQQTASRRRGSRRPVVDVPNQPRLVFTLVVATNRLSSRLGLCCHRAAGTSVDALHDVNTATTTADIKCQKAPANG
jgi:hypothetical protein